MQCELDNLGSSNNTLLHELNNEKSAPFHDPYSKLSLLEWTDRNIEYCNPSEWNS